MEITVTSENYESEVLKSDKPVIIDFWAPWCGPCKALAPKIQEIAEENPDIKVCLVNVDENMELAREHKVMSIPTIVAVKDGKVVNKVIAPDSKEKILDMLK